MVVPLLLVWPPSTPVGEQSRQLPREGLEFNEGPFVIRICTNLDMGGEAQQEGRQDGQNQDGEQAPANGGLLSDLMLTRTPLLYKLWSNSSKLTLPHLGGGSVMH